MEGKMAADFEGRLQETGKRLYQLIEGESPTLFQKQYWTGKVLDWCMRDDAFRVQMFRFIDVFPYLTQPEAIARHLQEYFVRPELKLPSALQWGIKVGSSTSFTAKMVAKSFADNITNMAGQFILGSTPQAALAPLERLRSLGMAFTADLLGEAVVSESEAEDYFDRYLELFEVLNDVQDRWPALGESPTGLDWGHSPKINVSVKASAMYSQMRACAFDHAVARAKERLRPLFRKAIEIGAFVNLDMEHHGLKNLTLSLYRSLMEEAEFHDYPSTGIALQCYRRDSEADLHELIRWARDRKVRFTIRLVKGAYWDSEVIWAQQGNWPIPVFANKHETDANFEELARIILQHHELTRLACASHNLRALAYVIETARDLRIPSEEIEFQVLYGMGEPIRNALRKAGSPVRVYAPIGEMLPGMAYLVRRLLENTANESFLRQKFAQGVAVEALLRNPLDILREQPPPSEAPETTREYDTKGPFQNEPLWDWTLAEHREHFSEALRRVRRSLPRKVPLGIAGKAVLTERKIHSVNPNAPDEVIGVVAAADMSHVDRAIEAASAAFPSWRETDYRDRAEFLFAAAERARKMRYDLAALQVFEVGKAWSEADADVCEAIDFLEYYGREMLRLGQSRRMGQVPGELSHLLYEPRGVCAVIAPWNFPLAISMGMTSAAIVTGNTVVYKPASQSPVIGSMIYDLFREVRLPLGVLNFLPGSGAEIGDVLVSHPEVALIAFTGSKETGLHLIERATKTSRYARGIKHVIAEMGGKNAIIVDADADLDEAVTHVLQSAFGYQGQKCSACSRVIVLEENYDRLIERLRSAAESIDLGPVEDPKNYMGAVIEPAARDKVLAYIAIGEEEGSLLLQRDCASSPQHSAPDPQHPFYVPLTIFTDIRPEHRLAQEEIFGPVLAIMKVKDFDEALAVANGTQYALTGAVFSRSPENIARARKEFRVGNLYINRGCTGALVHRHPFGGFKMSGVGSKAGGPDYLLQFMVPRNIVENTLRRGFAPSNE
jgi:RHH-type transcriptional regulator, proline utilization regulon repressor / proline dehydrogenase / delta 1-pyrroline-5-carboxylate dehydrogenase